MTTFLDYDRLAAIDIDRLRATRPYPWINPARLLTEDGYQRLLSTLPAPERLQPFFGIQRSHGQQPHDRLVLEYDRQQDVPAEWHAFIRELHGPAYTRFLRRAFGRRFFMLSFHWHYTPSGCSVSPHCDAKHKLGSHIFYFNTEQDWQPEWGGQTLVLDDGGRFRRDSAPAFEEFDHVATAEGMGNRSFLFVRQDKSWHGVKEIRCPEGAYRKVFIVVVNDFARGIRRLVETKFRGGKSSGY